MDLVECGYLNLLARHLGLSLVEIVPKVFAERPAEINYPGNPINLNEQLRSD